MNKHKSQHAYFYFTTSHIYLWASLTLQRIGCMQLDKWLSVPHSPQKVRD